MESAVSPPSPPCPAGFGPSPWKRPLLLPPHGQARPPGVTSRVWLHHFSLTKCLFVDIKVVRYILLPRSVLT